MWPCRLSLPALNRLNTDFSPDDFAVVAISVDYVMRTPSIFIALPGGLPRRDRQDRGFGRAFAVSGMPSGYLIGRDGLIREVHVGFRKGDEEALRAQIAHSSQSPETSADCTASAHVSGCQQHPLPRAHRNEGMSKARHFVF
ncbi:MAG: hypothetical protein CM15mP84_05930 [Cellvibrionales bacterium]|nr:MAG: hypothetical protein CM15mP84_05930 [Cellvibrionales bacterium]